MKTKTKKESLILLLLSYQKRKIVNGICLSLLFVLTMQSCGHKNTYYEQLSIPLDAKEIEPNRVFNTEEYHTLKENSFKDALQNPLSTFSIDVDNASYSNVRRFLSMNQLPPVDAVRIEEMINYFEYNYPQPQGEYPFCIYTEVAVCPWNNKNQLIHIGIQGKSLGYENLKASNFVFLVDASGSMEDANKLPLVRESLSILLEQLSENDKVAIVAYAGAAGVILNATPANEKEKILDALDELKAGGSTAGGEGIELAYKIAKENIVVGGNNRVILCTDGDFNVGTSSTSELVKLIEEKRKDDIYLTICGYGMGNYKDGRMEQISNAGNGNYFYIDNRKEAQKVFEKEMQANMFSIAKDVKIQVEFNPTKVKAYRLIGYEDRVLANEEFNDDTKDAGELGAGHTVTALYEIVPIDTDQEFNKHDALKYQESSLKKFAKHSDDLLTLKLRYKPIQESESKLLETTVKETISSLHESSSAFQFSAAVAEFGMLLRNSKEKGSSTYESVLALAQAASTQHSDEYKKEFIELVETAANISK